MDPGRGLYAAVYGMENRWWLFHRGRADCFLITAGAQGWCLGLSSRTHSFFFPGRTLAQHVLTSPNSKMFSRKRDLHPMDDEAPLEHLSQKFDASLFVVGTGNKKRPFNITLGRCERE